MIQPTPGRVVHFHPGTHDSLRAQVPDGRPLAAHVAYVWGDRMVNLMVIDANGNPHSRTSVTLLQDDDKPVVHGAGVAGVTPLAEGYAAWMDYQKGQAAKTEAHASATEVRLQQLEATVLELTGPSALELGSAVRQLGLAGK